MVRECRQNSIWYSHKHQMNSEWLDYSFQVRPRQEVTLHLPGLRFPTLRKVTYADKCWHMKVRQMHMLLWFIPTLETHLPSLEGVCEHVKYSPPRNRVNEREQRVQEPWVPWGLVLLHWPKELNGVVGWTVMHSSHPTSLFPAPSKTTSETMVKSVKFIFVTSSPHVSVLFRILVSPQYSTLLPSTRCSSLEVLSLPRHLHFKNRYYKRRRLL